MIAFLKQFKQPSGLVAHLHAVGTGSPFLVDGKGKPKDNISVSVNPLRCGWQGRTFFASSFGGAVV